MKCSKCGTEMTALDSFRCPRCNKITCLDHRMPDRHDCYQGDPLKGIEVNSIMGNQPAASAAKPAADGRVFQREQPAPAKKKRFGLF